MSEVPNAGRVHQGPDAAGNGTTPLNGRTVDRGHAKDLFRRFVETRNPALREELVGLHLPLVEAAGLQLVERRPMWPAIPAEPARGRTLWVARPQGR